MSVFDPIRSLPVIGSRESPQLDFKAVLDRTKDKKVVDRFELAKDVASMASVYGGALLIGACEDRATGQLARYKALTDAEAQEAIGAYQEAVRDLCVPQPLIDPVAISHEDGFVVAINVHPVLDRVVAVKVTPIDGHRFGDRAQAYVFPVRLSTHAIPFTPEQIPMLMNAAIRRIVILIEGIPRDERERIDVAWAGFLDGGTNSAAVMTTPFTFDGGRNDREVVDLNHNALELVYRGSSHVRIPLDDIQTVWKGSDGTWCLRVSGWFQISEPRAAYRTRCTR